MSDNIVEYIGNAGLTADSVLMDKKAVAARLGLCPRTVERLVQRGMPCYRLGYKTVRYRWSDVIDWLEKNYRVSAIRGL